MVTSFDILPTLHHYSPLNAASVLGLMTSSAMALIQQQNVDFLKLKRKMQLDLWKCKGRRNKTWWEASEASWLRVRTSHEFQLFFVRQKTIAQYPPLYNLQSNKKLLLWSEKSQLCCTKMHILEHRILILELLHRALRIRCQRQDGHASLNHRFQLHWMPGIWQNSPSTFPTSHASLLWAWLQHHCANAKHKANIRMMQVNASGLLFQRDSSLQTCQGEWSGSARSYTKLGWSLSNANKKYVKCIHLRLSTIQLPCLPKGISWLALWGNTEVKALHFFDGQMDCVECLDRTVLLAMLAFSRFFNCY